MQSRAEYKLLTRVRVKAISLATLVVAVNICVVGPRCMNRMVVGGAIFSPLTVSLFDLPAVGGATGIVMSCSAISVVVVGGGGDNPLHSHRRHIPPSSIHLDGIAQR